MNSNIQNHSNNNNQLSDMLEKGREHYRRTHLRHIVLKAIKENEPISIFDLRRKIDNIGYGTLWEIIRHFEFCALVVTDSMINEYGREVKIVFIPKKIKKENGGEQSSSPLYNKEKEDFSDEDDEVDNGEIEEEKPTPELSNLDPEKFPMLSKLSEKEENESSFLLNKDGSYILNDKGKKIKYTKIIEGENENIN